MAMLIVETARRRGRPPAFDRMLVLERAMNVFWARGYDGASMPTLTEAMGISAQSLYAAFASKDMLYREAVNLYRETISSFVETAMNDEDDAICGIAKLLHLSAILFTSEVNKPGCMITAAPAGPVDYPLVAFGRELRSDGTRKISDRLKRGVLEDQLNQNTDCDAVARYLSAVVQGMSVQARDGMGTEALLSTAKLTARLLEALRT